MKAAYYHGDRQIQLGESRIEPPVAGQVRLDVSYCGVCGTDLHIYLGHMDSRLSCPQVIGHEMSGKIAAVGSGVDDWSIGDRVVVRPLDSCGSCAACRAGHQHICQSLNFLGIDTPGAFQGSWTVPAHTLHALPANVSMEEAALVEPIAVAVHDVRLGEVQKGENVVVIGGGPIGMLVALVARHAGGNVVVSEVNPFRLGLANSLGLEAIDPRTTDVAEFVEERTNGAGADAVFEVSGTQAGVELMTQLPRTRGRMVVVAIHAEPPKIDLFRFFWRELRLCGVRVYEPEDFEEAIRLTAEGSLPLNQLITHRRPLEDLHGVFQQMERGDDIMKVLIDTQGS